MIELFKLVEDAILISCRARYDGRADFERNFYDTGYVNIGSMVQPLYFTNACECEVTEGRQAWA